MFFMNTKDTSLLWDLLFHNRSLYLALSPNNLSRHFTSCHHDPRTDTINTYYFEWTVLGGKVNQMLFFVNVKRKEVKFEKKNHLDGCHLCSDRWIGLKVIQSVKVANTTEKHIFHAVTTWRYSFVLICKSSTNSLNRSVFFSMLQYSNYDDQPDQSFPPPHLWKSSSSFVPSTPLILSLINWFAWKENV